MTRITILAAAALIALTGVSFAQEDDQMSAKVAAFKTCLVSHGVTATGPRPGCRVTEEGIPQCLPAAAEIGTKCAAWVKAGGDTVHAAPRRDWPVRVARRHF